MERVSSLKESAVEMVNALKESTNPQKNQKVLDNLGENESGDLTYKGKAVGVPTPQDPIDAKLDWAEALINIENANIMAIECSLLPVNARVKKIEIPDVVNDTDEYISLEDMVAKDPNGITAPYYVMYPKNMQGVYFTAVAFVVFTNMPNEFYNSATANLFDNKTIKIYYEIEV